MVEVFKTNVQDHDHANMLVYQIHQVFTDYKANFDLEDCDRILRVKSSNGLVHSSPVIELLRYYGFEAEVLPDEVPPSSHQASPHSLEQFLQ
ncbi:MAG TPA: hypothetical protein VD993_20370 [Chitinophagaceae bacterium]|nr:hypothetical protein [Chitinophagaceae bacterium]